MFDGIGCLRYIQRIMGIFGKLVVMFLFRKIYLFREIIFLVRGEVLEVEGVCFVLELVVCFGVEKVFVFRERGQFIYVGWFVLFVQVGKVFVIF